MKILFSNPPWWVERQILKEQDGSLHARCIGGVRAGSRWPHTFPTPSSPDRFVYGTYLPYPFFLGYAATYAEKHLPGSRVTMRDSIALAESYRSYLEHLEVMQYDWIVIESSVPSLDHDLRLIHRIVSVSPRSRIIVTGPAWVRAEEILASAPVHAVVKGEYEKGVVAVIEGGSGIIDFDLLSETEMNAAPFPWFDDLIALRYYDCNPKGMQFPHLQAWTSRGCPFKCIFCVWPATMTGNDPDGTGTRMVRYYAKEYVRDFLKEMVRRYPYRSIYFDDDTFNLGNRHVREMCEVMREIGLPWSAMCRTDTISMDLWREMKESGCFGVKLGFESGCQQVVDTIVNKHLDLERAREVVHHIKSLGMTVHGTFTYGLPGESREQMLETKRYIQSLPLDSLQESGCAEIEGTPLAAVMRGEGSEIYPGAMPTDEYRRETDGARKWREMIATMASE